LSVSNLDDFSWATLAFFFANLAITCLGVLKILGMSRDDPVDEQQQQDDEEDPVLEQEEEEDEIGRNSSHYHDGDRSIPKKDHVEVEERSTCPITTVIGSTSTTNENEHVEEEERRWRLWVVSWGVYS
jgi:hypothetical protein